jgi:drug/metabolite transporter (DMT)-like permease
MWLTVSIINMLLVTAMRLLQKGFVSRSSMNPFRINWLVFGLSLPVVILLAILNIHVIMGLSLAFWLVLVAVVIGFYPAVNYLFFEVIRREELSNVLPLMSLIPILTALFGWLFLGQKPTILALGGIICVGLAIYCLHLRGSKTWYEPLQALAHARSTWAMAIVSVITAIAAIGDKFAIEHSTTIIYFALNSIGAFTVLLVSDRWPRAKKYPTVRSDLARLSDSQVRLLISLGLVQLMAQMFSFVAVDVSANTSYTIAIRNLNIVTASLLALVLYHESVNRYKLLSYGLAALGVVMIAI